MSSKIIKIEALVLNQSDPKLFSDAMEDNFGFEFDRNQFIIDGPNGRPQFDDDAIDSEAKKIAGYKELCQWQNVPVNKIDEFVIGQIFRAIRTDSKMYTYQVIAKTNNRSLYYPLNDGNNPPLQVGKITTFDFENGNWKCIAIADIDTLSNILFESAQDGNFYMVTDLDDDPIDGVFNDDDDDDDEESLQKVRYCHIDSNDEDGNRIPQFIPVSTLVGMKEIFQKYIKAQYKMFEAIKANKANMSQDSSDN